MKRNTWSGILLLIVGVIFTGTSWRLYADDSSANDIPPYRPFGVTLDLGPFTGVGGLASYRPFDHFGVRGGFEYFDYGYTGTIKDVSYDINMRYMNEPLLLDIFPWTKSSFHISAGAVFNQFRLQGTANPSATSTVTINGNTYTGAQLGTLNLDIRPQPVSAYLGIGGNFFYFDTAHHWSMGGELGAMYTGSPKVQLTQTGGMQSAQLNNDLAAERDKIHSYARDLEFWPVLKLGVTFAF